MNREHIWHRIRDTYTIAPDDMETAGKLFQEYNEKGYITQTCKDILQLTNGTIAEFYCRLLETGDCHSPVKDRSDSSWMNEIDFCFMNIRATGIDEKPGNFIHAAKLLPIIRAGGIHLGPFTRYEFGVIYAVNSVEVISHKVVDPFLAERGISADDQLRAFVDAAHLLGKCIGFDLEPHVTQFAIPVLMHPKHFRWIKLNEHDKHQLEGGLSNDDMVSRINQEKIVAGVRTIVQQYLNQNGIEDLEIKPGDTPEKEKLKNAVGFEIKEELIRKGYWTIPSHTWGGVGVPAFAGYDENGNFPRFRYLTKEGEEQTELAFHILTPFKFYSSIPVNQVPDRKQPPARDDGTVTWFCDIFSKWRDDFGFDFLRYDSVDHIFDSTLDSPDIPSSDRPTPYVLEQCIRTSKTDDKPYIGNLAERMGNEITDYAGIGFDLMLGSDMLERIDTEHIRKSFEIYDTLIRLNESRSTPFSVLYCVDTHDTGNPFIWGEPLIQKYGARGMALRLFLSRFTGCGNARRPKYEVMGLQDLSYGLYAANVKDINLQWNGNVDFNRFYHYLEDLYHSLKPLLNRAEIVQRYVCKDYAWWVMTAENRVFVPVISLENDAPPDIITNISIDLSSLVTDEKKMVRIYDFKSPYSVKTTEFKGQYVVDELPYLGFMLLIINNE